MDFGKQVVVVLILKAKMGFVCIEKMSVQKREMYAENETKEHNRERPHKS